MTTQLTLVHLYPDLLGTYGDRGNVLALRRRAEWRGFSVEVVPVSRRERLPRGTSLVVMGGGTDRVQELVARDLDGRREELAELAASGAVLLGVCGGYQLLGSSYEAADGTRMDGLGLLDVATAPGRGRIVGSVRAAGRLWEHRFALTGFENHGGRTALGPAAAPLAVVSSGGGNNETDGTEGAVQGSVVGTYLHGPVLPLNPGLADALLERALAPLTGGEPLARLDDSVELAVSRRRLPRAS